jgi:hypothetical protein
MRRIDEYLLYKKFGKSAPSRAAWEIERAAARSRRRVHVVVAGARMKPF